MRRNPPIKHFWKFVCCLEAVSLVANWFFYHASAIELDTSLQIH